MGIWEMRCYIRDFDGYIIEVGQHNQKMIDYLKGLDEKPNTYGRSNESGRRN